jgi:hypothetical protein
MDPDGRFHMIPYDNNETFHFAGGGGPNMWPSNDPMLSPVGHEDNDRLPVISRLLSVPALRARYLAHVRTIANEWLDWDVISPIIAGYQLLIDAEVQADSKMPYSYEAFANSATQDHSGGGFGFPGGGGFGPPPGNFGDRREGAPGREDGSGRPRRGGFDRGGRGGRGRRGGPGGGGTPGFKRFVEERREFLLSHPEINKPVPVIESVAHQNADAMKVVQVKAAVNGKVKAGKVILYYSTGDNLPFASAPMLDDGVYVGEIPPFPAGTKVRYYVEARSTTPGATTFEPSGAENGALTYQITAPVAEKSPVVINELMAINTSSLTDPQEQYEDWIELHNISDQEVDLSGMYLSDKKDNPRKWMFPENTTIPAGGYLIVWADEDGNAESGLHANFKLSRGGEAVILMDKDERGNAILDSIEFGEQEENVAIGRFPDGNGEFKKLTMTPGEKNRL